MRGNGDGEWWAREKAEGWDGLWSYHESDCLMCLRVHVYSTHPDVNANVCTYMMF